MKKKHTALRIIAGITAALVLTGAVYCTFGGFDTGSSADAAEFAKQVDRYQAKKMNWHESFTVMQTPLVLQISDSRVKPLPVVMSQSTLSKIFTKHNLSLPMVKQLPAALADPIMVLESEGSRDKRKKGLSLCWN